MSKAAHQTSNLSQSRFWTVKVTSSSPRAHRLRIFATKRNRIADELALEGVPRDGFATGAVPSNYAHAARARAERGTPRLHCRIRWQWRRQLSPSRSMLDGLSLRHFPVRCFDSDSGARGRSGQAGPLIRLCARLILAYCCQPHEALLSERAG